MRATHNVEALTSFCASPSRPERLDARGSEIRFNFEPTRHSGDPPSYVSNVRIVYALTYKEAKKTLKMIFRYMNNRKLRVRFLIGRPLANLRSDTAIGQQCNKNSSCTDARSSETRHRKLRAQLSFESYGLRITAC